jgi:hypothetical protein
MKVVIVLILFTVASCTRGSQEKFQSEIAEVKIYNEWLYAFKLNDLKINSDVITRPPGVEQLLFSLVLPTEGGMGLKAHCVYYRVAYKKIKGLIKIIEQKKEVTCPLVSAESPWLILEDVKDLSVAFLNFKLSLNFLYANKKKSWTFLLPNIEAGVLHEKYEPVTENKLYPGMTFLKITEESFNLGKNKYLGKLSDRLALGSAIRCQQIDKSCQQVGEYRCDECRYGWYQIVDYHCPQGGAKFCGQNHCGEKNEPACIRGTKVLEGDDEGICQSDLTPVMNADHILVCQ